MELDLLNRISNLNFQGYYDPSKNMVAIHFFNPKSEKPDVIAFLSRDLSWDIREIISETSMLYGDKEIITVEHLPICIQPQGSDFDKFVRVGLESMARETHGKDANLEEKDKMFKILNNGYRDN